MQFFNPNDHRGYKEHPDLLKARLAVDDLLWLLTISHGLSPEGSADANVLKYILFARIHMDRRFEEDESAILAVSDELPVPGGVTIGNQKPQNNYTMAVLDLARYVRRLGEERKDPETGKRISTCNMGEAVQLIIDAFPAESRADYQTWATQAIAVAQAILFPTKAKKLPPDLKLALPPDFKLEDAILFKEVCRRVDRKRFNQLVKEIIKSMGRKAFYSPLCTALALEPEGCASKINGEFYEALRARRKAPEQTAENEKWTEPHYISYWAKEVFFVGRNDMSKMLREQKIKNRKIHSRGVQIAVSCLPAHAIEKHTKPKS